MPLWSYVARTPILIILGAMLSACSALPQAPTPTPTRDFAGPTLAPSPTTQILRSNELYANEIRDGQNNLTAAALPNVGALPPVAAGTPDPNGGATVQIAIDANRVVLGDLYERRDGVQRRPGILLLNEDRLAWGLLPAELLAAGYTVLSVALPPLPQVSDVDILLNSLSETGSVDPGRIGVIGAERGADLALLACAENAICDALVMVSATARGTALNVVPNYAPRPLLLVASSTQPDSFETAQSIAAFAGDIGQFQPSEVGQGANIADANPAVRETIRAFFQAAFGL